MHTPISEIVDRIVAVSEQAIVEQGGRIEGEGSEAVYVIPAGR